MIKLNKLINEDLIYEGLIHSVSIEETLDMIQKWSGTKKIKVEISRPQIIKINSIGNVSKEDFNGLYKLINNLGWYISGILIFRSNVGLKWEKFDLKNFLENDINSIWVSLQLEAKYDLEVNKYDIDTVFHISNIKNKNKIMKLGLVPKTKNKILSHPERIYLTKEEEGAEIIAKEFTSLNPYNIFVIYEIDFKSLRKENPSIRLFLDPNFKRGFYTLSNIPSKFISIKREYRDE